MLNSSCLLLKRKLKKLFVWIFWGNLLSSGILHAQNWQLDPAPSPLPMLRSIEREVLSQALEHSEAFIPSVKPFRSDDFFRYQTLDSGLVIKHLQNKAKNLLWHRSLFNYHNSSPSWQMDVNPIVDFAAGKDFAANRNTVTNLRGAQIRGYFSNKFSFESNIFLYMGSFASYYDQKLSNNLGVMPGWRNADRFEGGPQWEFYQSTSTLSWAPNPWFHLQFGHNRNFVGFGHRSLIWSDAHGPYTNLRTQFRLGPLQYHYWIGIHQDLHSPKIPLLGQPSNFFPRYRQKYSAAGYLDWKINKRLQIGFFNAIISPAEDSSGARVIDLNYLNPIAFLRPIESILGMQGNSFMAMNIGFRPAPRTLVYGQIIMDEFHYRKALISRNGEWENKFGAQLGVKHFEKLGKMHSMFQLEGNVVRPFVYSHWSTSSNYGHMGQSFAHPMGANFYEILGLTDWGIGRWNFQAKSIYALIGKDSSKNQSIGQDINRPYGLRPQDDGYVIGGGRPWYLWHNEILAGYLLNPKSGLRIEVRYIHRNELLRGASNSERTRWLSIHLITRLFEHYLDF